MQRLGPALEASQVAWSRTAKRWGELTNPASRTDPALVGAASELRSAIAAAASNQGGWATPTSWPLASTFLPRSGPSSQHGGIDRHRLRRPRHCGRPPRPYRTRTHHRNEIPSEAEIAIEQVRRATKASPGPRAARSLPIE